MVIAAAEKVQQAKRWGQQEYLFLKNSKSVDGLWQRIQDYWQRKTNAETWKAVLDKAKLTLSEQYMLDICPGRPLYMWQEAALCQQNRMITNAWTIIANQGFTAPARMPPKIPEMSGTRFMKIQNPGLAKPLTTGVVTAIHCAQASAVPSVPLLDTTLADLEEFANVKIQNNLSERKQCLFNEASASVTQNVKVRDDTPSFKQNLREVAYQGQPAWLTWLLGDKAATTINKSGWLGESWTEGMSPDHHLIGLMEIEAAFKERTPKLLLTLINFGRRTLAEYNLQGITSQQAHEIIVASALTVYAGTPSTHRLARIYASGPFQARTKALNSNINK